MGTEGSKIIGTEGKRVYMVGIKGTGMSSLALFLDGKGYAVSGWDVGETFSTDSYLAARGILVDTDPGSFNSDSWDILIHSASYEESHPIIQRATSHGMNVFSYHQYLGILSSTHHVIAVAGTHGKTTTSGCIDHILTCEGLPHGALYGSQPLLSSDAVHDESSPLLVLEACEYRNHFHLYHIDTLLITNIEWEHTDFFADEREVFESFRTLVSLLAPGSSLIISLNSPAAEQLALWAIRERGDITVTTYGKGRGDVPYFYPDNGESHTLRVEKESFSTHLVGEGFMEDLVGASLAVSARTEIPFSRTFTHAGTFSGCSGRVELVSQNLYPWKLYTDYAHHPSEIMQSIRALRLLNPNSRIITCFYPHTVSRTKSLYGQFTQALQESDLLLIAPVASSARGDGDEREGIELSKHLALDANGEFMGDDEKMKERLLSILHSGDVCVTMGAGNTMGIQTLLLRADNKI